ncbi:MAG: hypothetical protein GX650_06505 [Clostridiales bacterium]|nr:hypothetical protein [Clostridiales bacterium]
MNRKRLSLSLLSLLMAFSLLMGMLPAGADGRAVIGHVTVTNSSSVNIRAGGNTSYPVVSKGAPGAMYEAVGSASSGWWEIVLDDGSTGFISNKLTSFVPTGATAQPAVNTAGIRATVVVSYRTESGQIITTDYVQVAYGANILSANDNKVPGYTLVSNRRVTVNVGLDGVATPATVVYTYRAGGAVTAAPQGTVQVPIYYKDVFGSLLYTDYAYLTAGSRLIIPNNALVPPAYSLVGPQDIVVSVSASLVAMPSTVTFLYALNQMPTQAPAVQATVPVYYINNQGAFLNSTSVTLPVGYNTVTANSNLVPAGYMLISAASVGVNVAANGMATPGSVTFTYMQSITQAPPKTTTIPVYYKAEDGSQLNQAYVSVTQGNNAVQPQAGMAPAGYTLVSQPSVNVTVDGNGTANPGWVTFTYRAPAPPVTVNIPVIYRDHTGAQVNATTASVSSNVQNTVTANDALAPSGYVLVSPRKVTVTVNAQGITTPTQVVFTYQDPSTITEPTHLPDYVKAKPNPGSWPVYTGPGPDYYRVGNATLGGGTIRVYGREGGWVLIGYGLSNGGYRIGYVTADAIPASVQPPTLRLVRVPKSNVATSVFVDDPIVSKNRELSVRFEGGGHPFTLLGFLSTNWAYVEVDNFQGSGKPARGFIGRKNLGI